MQRYDVVINKENRMSPAERPEDLLEVQITFAPDTIGEKRMMRREAADQLRQMLAEAWKQEIYLVGVSGFRSYERQKEIYDQSLSKRGEEHTKRYIAPPGGSEHQTGLAMDLSCEAVLYDLIEGFAKTKEGIWLQNNAYLYGFIIRYPKGKDHITGYAYEPWHVRYVTQPLAFCLKKMDQTLEEYQQLGQSFT